MKLPTQSMVNNVHDYKSTFSAHSMVNMWLCFGGTWCIHLEGRTNTEVTSFCRARIYQTTMSHHTNCTMS